MATSVEFYKVTFKKEESQNSKTLKDYFASIVSKSFGFKDQYDRDFYDFNLIQAKYYGGSFRKIRTDEIIETGKVGAAAKKLSYTKGEGKLETNHLVFFPKYSVIGYIRNVHANHYKRLESCLSEAFCRDVIVSPLITAGSLNQILQNRTVVAIDFSVPISSAQATNNGQLWSDKAMKAVDDSGGDILKMQIGLDLRKSERGIISKASENISNLLSFNPTRAVVKTQDIDGKYDLIDLIADKIVYKDETYSYTKDALQPSAIYDKIVTAYLGKLDEIEQVC
ncbi:MULTISPECIES: hypothetical protein [Psychrobacter]|uniref:hypothetical protein n=1 Tax=Psychrobacter TaxID=497 RepID=UPI000EEADF6C|nr:MULTISPECIES: hypothetical protein [Psychrobacter]HCN17052.1 hypothetical protein [Psychrobacter sp.]